MVVDAGPTLGLQELVSVSIVGTDNKYSPRSRAEEFYLWQRELTRCANSQGLSVFMARKGQRPTAEEVALALGSNTLSEREVRTKFLNIMRLFQAHNTRLF